MKVLFVDDDPKILGSLRRMIAPEKSIDASFASGGKKALEMLAAQPVDIIVADMRMPDMDGATLLSTVQKKYPDIVRVVLSGYSSNGYLVKATRPAHIFLSKPCSFDEIMHSLGRVYNLKSIFTDKRLRSVAGSIGMLPVLPKAYTALVAELKKENCSISTLGKIIATDAGLTAGILKIVNSSFFGLPAKIKTPAQAVTFIGTDLMRGLVLSHSLFKSFDLDRYTSFSINRLWEHSLTTAFFCREISKISELEVNRDEAFNAGLLHDVGKLIFADRLSEDYMVVLESVKDNRMTIQEAEEKKFGVTHARMGAYLLGLWGFSEDLVRAVADHHGTGAGHVSALGVVVHAANVFQHELVVINPEYAKPALDREIIAKAGMKLRALEEWKEICASLLDRENKPPPKEKDEEK